ncbi:MAG: UDP-2,3-diacylglucosamine diphosphatase [Bacteroidia bacterium]
MSQPKKIYFASDFHLGAPDHSSSLVREKHIVSWLIQIQPELKELYILGDIFDFWFEYKHAVPKGYIRLLGKLAEISDSGIPIHIFVGNHDLWMKDYFEQEIGAKIYREPVVKEIDGRRFYLAHGDGLGPGDNGFKLMKKVFTSPVSNWLYSRLHPNFGIGLANYFARRSRKITGVKDKEFFGDKEWLIQHSRQILAQQPIDYFVYGHRHYPLTYKLSEKSTYINLGDWINYNTYAVWDGEELKLEVFES